VKDGVAGLAAAQRAGVTKGSASAPLPRKAKAGRAHAAGPPKIRTYRDAQRIVTVCGV
jgi:hypothetical protein